MSNILKSIGNVNELLDDPLEQRPGLDKIHSALIRNIQDMYNSLSNTSEAWTFDETDITVEADTDTYALEENIRANFGKPLLLSTYSSNTSAIERVIPFYDIQNLKFDWFLPENWRGINGFPTGGDHFADRVSFFYDTAGVPKLRFLPTPQSAAVYRLKYTLGNWASSFALSGTPILTNHHHLFEIRSAMDVLYSSEWEGIKKKAAREKRDEIKSYLTMQETRYLPPFQKYVKDMTHSKLKFKRAWDE